MTVQVPSDRSMALRPGAPPAMDISPAARALPGESSRALRTHAVILPLTSRLPRNALSKASRSAAVAYPPPAALPDEPNNLSFGYSTFRESGARSVYPAAAWDGNRSDDENPAVFIPAGLKT